MESWREFFPLALRRLDRRASVRLAEAARRNPVLRGVALVISHSGDGVIWTSAAVAAFIGLPENRQPVLYAALAMYLSAILVWVGKMIVRRDRPSPPLPKRLFILPGHDPFSFPSGHAARAASIAASAHLLPNLPVLNAVRWPLTIWAMGVCWARVSLSAHYILDVFVGAIIGLITAMLSPLLWSAVVG
jgi:undecaprenyl-diphosphatase